MRDETIAAAVECVTRDVMDALTRGEAPTPDALRVLLRVYAATGRDDIRDALERGLADALEISAGSSSESAARWLVLFAETADASDDERVRGAASNLALKVRMLWGSACPVALVAVSADACLRANCDVQAAVNELERLVSRNYEPGEGLGGSADDEVRFAGALLTAFSVTGRLPYAMLAEELLQRSRRTLVGAADMPFALGCDASAVLSRMAALHQDDDYRAAAVMAPDADYAADAALILERLAADVPGRGLGGAAYALAAGELQSAFPCP